MSDSPPIGTVAGTGLSPSATARLLESRARLLRMLQGRTHDPEEAEDILQAAFVRALEKADTLKSEDRVVGWFATLIRNLSVDRVRRRAVERRVLGELSRATPEEAADPLDAERAVCDCVRDILPTLKHSYREIIEKAELDGHTLKQVAETLDLSPGNARVRLHRARKALKRRLVEVCGACSEHRHLDCWCKEQRPRLV